VCAPETLSTAAKQAADALRQHGLLSFSLQRSHSSLVAPQVPEPGEETLSAQNSPAVQVEIVTGVDGATNGQPGGLDEVRGSSRASAQGGF
jgi:hypothetical protein